jgi:hypothetical protein
MNESKKSQKKVRSKKKDDIQTIVKNAEKANIMLKKDFNSGNIINYGLGHMYGSW